MNQDKIIDIEDLTPDAHNFNQGTDEGRQLMQRSLTELGAGRSILVDRNGNVIAGNKTQEAAIKAGIRRVRVIETDGTELVAVKRTDIDIDSAKGRELALVDNLATQVNLAWDEAELEAMDVEGFDPGQWGWEPPEIQGGNTEQGQGEQPEAKEDDFDPDEAGESKVNAGDIWQLGRHRLMCGDSTKRDCVDKLMNGVIPDFVFTDPPYGINLKGDNSKRGSSTSLMQGGLKLKDFIDDSTEYACKAWDIVQEMGVKKQVWFGANYYCHHLPETNNWLVWDKRVEEKMNNTNSDCELAWVLDGHKSCRIFRYLWNGLLKAGEKGQKRVHPTQKPIALISHCFNRYAPEAKTLLDLFGGSGSSLIAAEQLGIQCYIMELDTHYAGVIIARWEKLTGQKAVKL